MVPVVPNGVGHPERKETPDMCQADVTFYLLDTKSQAGMTQEGTNPTCNFREGGKTLTKQLMPLVRNI